MAWQKSYSSKKNSALQSYCSHLSVVLLSYDSRLIEPNTTGELRKIWIGSFLLSGYSLLDFFLRSSHIRVDLLLYESNPTDKWEGNDWRAGKNLDSLFEIKVVLQVSINHFSSSSSVKEELLLKRKRNNRIEKGIFWESRPIFSVIESYCSRLSVILLSQDSRSTLLRLKRRIKVQKV